MPLRLGTTNATLRVGSSAVSRAYVGSTLAFSGSGTTPPVVAQPPVPAPPPPPNTHAAPTNVAAVAGDASASLSWSSVSGPTAWLVQVSTDAATWAEIPSGGLTFSAAPSATGTTSLTGSATVTGLTNGTSYWFRVASLVGDKWSGYSASSSAVTPYPPATAIASIAVDVPAGTQVLRVTWDSGALQSAANTPALYELQKSADGGTTWSPASSWLYSQQRAQEQFVWGYGQGVPPGWTGGAISQGSFMPATEYRFRLRRTRYAPGTSLQILPATAWVATSAGVTTPAAGAGAPRGISAEPLSTGAAVSWIAPQFSGSSAITSYKVYVLAVGASPSGATPSATVSASDTASTIFRISDSVGYDVKRAVISGLVNGQQYAVWIGAVNSTGETIAAGPLVTPSAAVLGQFASFVAEPKAAGCTHPDGAAWGEMALRVSRAEYVAWGSGVTIEAQYQRAGSLSADWMVWSGGNVSSGPVNPQFFDPKWFNAVNPGSWYWKPDGSNETTATHIQTVIEEGPTLGSRGPNLTTGVDYVFRARPVKGTVVGPWSYSTAKTNCRYA